MKKVIALLLAIMMLVSLAACGKNPETPNITEPPADQQTEPVNQESGQVQETEQVSQKEEITPENWGIKEMWSAINTTYEDFTINFPESGGYSERGGLVSEQSDGSVAIVGGQNDRCPAINNVSEVFPAYFVHLERVLEGTIKLSSNFEFTVDHDEAVMIGEYSMHCFTGWINCEKDKVPVKYPFVAYAVQLEDNGAYAYWVVYDDSEKPDTEIISKHAYNMALTYREDK